MCLQYLSHYVKFESGGLFVGEKEIKTIKKKKNSFFLNGECICVCVEREREEIYCWQITLRTTTKEDMQETF